jgi:hypothetical protein
MLCNGQSLGGVGVVVACIMGVSHSINKNIVKYYYVMHTLGITEKEYAKILERLKAEHKCNTEK